MKNSRPLVLPATGAVLVLLSSASLAQTMTGAAPASSAATGASLLTDNNPDGASLQPAWLIKPRISLTETITDNVNVGNSGNGKQSDQITTLAPGVRIEARSARLKGYFDYTVRQQYYAQNSDYNRTQNSLSTFSTLEAVDNWLFVDVSGTIAQQSISAFGPQSTSTTSINSNSAETSTYRVSPYIRGQIGGAAEYLLRYSASTTRSDSASASNVDLTQWTGQLRGSTPFRRLSWTLDGNQQSTDYSSRRKTDADLVRAIGTYAIQPDFRVSLSAGREANNYASLEQESRNTRGFGFDWTPTERTRISAFKERRFFGDGHTFSFSHRFPLSSISYTDTKDVSVLPPQYFAQNSDTQLGWLCPAGVDVNDQAALIAKCQPVFALTQNIFQTTQATVQRRQQLSLSLQGVRNTITLTGNRSESQSLSTLNGFLDTSTQSSAIEQRGVSVNLSHRLSEESNLNMLASRQESIGMGTTEIKSTTRFYQLSLTTKLGAKSSASLSARRTQSETTNNPYSENAVIGSINFVY